ncbi:hypothetical protein Ae201684P_005515 [Aphanomyces euteiches]|uniref:Uncharacterized protein n=1 Tax=Aphanomyces euteiches TaxID=100861 RepID=A0A6G0X0S1_9STRA|nr:hypothetical protein Ae201684_009691 [Aphanomyces euteiches]KAH9085815.1 hypothetical protein Ae201684P_005515 [Aphanomyces euteiches]
MCGCGGGLFALYLPDDLGVNDSRMVDGSVQMTENSVLHPSRFQGREEGPSCLSMSSPELLLRRFAAVCRGNQCEARNELRPAHDCQLLRRRVLLHMTSASSRVLPKSTT